MASISTQFRNRLTDLAAAGREFLELTRLSGKREQSLEQLCDEMMRQKGEASSIALADQLLQQFALADAKQRLSFFTYLLVEQAADATEVNDAIDAYRVEPSLTRLSELRQVLDPPRREVIRTLNTAPNGTLSLVQFRSELLDLVGVNPALDVVDKDLSYLLQEWFNRGFLELRQIDWQTPAFILEQLIEYEAVHEIQGWDDLRRRLASDRRCFAFFHPAMPNEPLIFVQVALAQTMATSIQDLLNQPTPETNESLFRNAIFYSISNCQSGLRGISFGNFLIKHVVEMLAAEIPSIDQFVTLSPIPGFNEWLRSCLSDRDSNVLTDDHLTRLGSLDLEEAHRFSEADKHLLRETCAVYLVNAKTGQFPCDPVARFHLGNGARLEQINLGADTSEKGLRESCGMLVNYLYDSASVTRNHEAYSDHGEIAMSKTVASLLPAR